MQKNPLISAIDADIKALDLNSADYSKDFDNLYQALELFQEVISSADIESLFDLKVKPLERMLLEQPGWLQYYSQYEVELSSASRYLQLILDEHVSKIWISLTENHKRDLNGTDKAKYINSSTEYLRLRKPILAIEEMLEKAKSVTGSLTAQGYSLTAYFRSRVVMEG